MFTPILPYSAVCCKAIPADFKWSNGKGKELPERRTPKRGCPGAQNRSKTAESAARLRVQGKRAIMHWLVRGADDGRSKRFRGEDENADQETVFQIRVAKYIGDGGDFAVYSGGHLFYLTVGGSGRHYSVESGAAHIQPDLCDRRHDRGGCGNPFCGCKRKGGEECGCILFQCAVFCHDCGDCVFGAWHFCTGGHYPPSGRRRQHCGDGGSIYPDFHAVRTLLYVELHLQRFCAQ